MEIDLIAEGRIPTSTILVGNSDVLFLNILFIKNSDSELYQETNIRIFVNFFLLFGEKK